MLSTSFTSALAALAVFSASVTALPPPPGPGRPGIKYTPAKNLDKLAKDMPLNGLPAPDGQLKYVVLGVGTQNYTCTTGNADAAPGTTGALGKFFWRTVKFNVNTKFSLPL